MTKRVLLTGAAGFIGSHLLDRILADTDWNVVCLDRLDSAGNLARLAKSEAFNRNRDRVEVVFHDLRAAVSKTVAAQLVTGNYRWGHMPFDHVLHLAAGSHVDRSVLDPAGFILDNVLGTAHLLDFCRDHAEDVLYFSTDEVTGPAAPGIAYGPYARMNPLNPYAASKAGGELLCSAYANSYGQRIVVTHCVNVVGEGQDHEKFLPTAVRKILAGGVVQVHCGEDGTPCSRFYTYQGNITGALLKVLASGERLDGSGERGKYNLGGDVEHSNVELCQKVAGILGLELRHKLVKNPPGRMRPDLRYGLDVSDTLALGWVPEFTFDDGLRRTVEWYAARSAAE